jgi:D-glycero-D-manno-heptose 1,7-bisphosphate phosphatase
MTQAVKFEEGIGPVEGSVMRRAVFLDRDGVINQAVIRDGKPYPPADATELVIAPGTAEHLRRLKSGSFLLIVVTNQPDIARGTQGVEVCSQIHERLRAELPLDDIFICPHDDRDQCDCRKPLPGLILRASRRYDIDLGASYLIGDRWRDIDAAAAAGVTAVLIDRGYRERGPSQEPALRVGTLEGAVEWILGAAG